MDGAPVRGESIPIRVFLAGYDLAPTMRDINKKFSVRYYLNLVLMDEEDRRYFKQQVNLYIIYIFCFLNFLKLYFFSMFKMKILFYALFLLSSFYLCFLYFVQEITLWRKGEKSRKSQTASPHMPSHLVSAETGFPQGAAQNGPPSVPPDSGQLPTNSVTNIEDTPAPIEGMTREEGDGEGEKEGGPESD